MERRITIDRLWFEFGKDELYGEEFPGLGESKSIQAVESILKAIGFNKTGFRLKPWCRKCIPGNDYPPLTLALVLCGMDELNTFLPGEKEPTGWKYESFSKNFRDDLEIDLNDLKYLMRRRELPLPVSLFPNEQGNTEEAIRLDEKEYSDAFTAFAAISDIEREIDEWQVMNPISITEKSLKEEKLKELRAKLREVKNGTQIGIDSINPIYNVTDDDMQRWAQEEYWPKSIAISRVVSSRREDMNTMKARVRNLLAKLSMPPDATLAPSASGQEESWEKQTESIQRDGVTCVRPMAWLKWCDKKGFPASSILWDLVNAKARDKKTEVFCDQYPGVEPNDIARILELDHSLCSESNLSNLDSSSILFNEYCQRTDDLESKGWDDDEARDIGAKIIEKGCLLVSIGEWKGKTTPTAMDKKVQQDAIGNLQKRLHALDCSSNVKAARKAKQSSADKRQIALIEKVRELMQHELDTTWPDGKRGLKIYVIRKHYVTLKLIYGDTTAENMAGKTKPVHLTRLKIETPLPS